MNDQVWIAVLGVVTTLIVNVAAVVIAYMKLRAPVRLIHTATNGMLREANARAEAAHNALADAAAIALSTGAHDAGDGPPPK